LDVFDPISYASGVIPSRLEGVGCMNIYVGGLSPVVTNQQLREVFAAFGKVDSAEVAKEHPSGVPRGFGFVKMPLDHEATAAIAALNGRKRLGGSLQVHPVRRPPPRPWYYRPAAPFSAGKNRGKKSREQAPTVRPTQAVSSQ
jgi:RNA recognition motif-containing protein